MRYFFLLLSLTGIAHHLFAQNPANFISDTYAEKISFIRMDSVQSSQSTVIEYDKFLVVIELPFLDYGADKTTGFKEDLDKAKSMLLYLKQKYNKPVKYVLSSHWHLHSLSGITPFLDQGAMLVTAQSNWDYSVQNGLLGDQPAEKYREKVIGLTKDTTLLTQTKMPISVVYMDSTYQYKPTRDFLFFYLPKIKTLHASCMCALQEIDFSKRKNYKYSDRLTDLKKAIIEKKLEVNDIIKLGRFEHTKEKYYPPVFTKEYLNAFMRNGQAMAEAVKSFTKLEEKYILQKQDSLMASAIQQKISPNLLNNVVYACLKDKAFGKAIIYAKLLNLYSPGDPYYLDTLGEAYFASGDITTAAFYAEAILKIDPKFSTGLETWEAKKKNGY